MTGPIRLILASASPARRQLLSEAGYDFEVRPAGIDEPSGAGFAEPRAYVEHVAWKKARAVATAIGRSAIDACIIISADTVGWIDGRPVGKPADEADARRILERLAGTEHELWTGVCLWRRPDDLQIAFQEQSKVAMRALSRAELDAYLRTRQWQGCSGAYAIEIGDDPYVRVVSGSKTNVIGLPMERLKQVLAELKIEAPAELAREA
jgi:septum formation protein